MSEITKDEFDKLTPEDKVAEIHVVITTKGELLWRGPQDVIEFRGLLMTALEAFNQKQLRMKQSGLIKQVVLGGLVKDPRLNGGN